MSDAMIYDGSECGEGMADGTYGPRIPRRVADKIADTLFAGVADHVAGLRAGGADDGDVRVWLGALFEAVRRRQAASQSSRLAKVLAAAEASWPAKLNVTLPANAN
jgi:hypothetical protein